jgi:hypothetical protein
MAGNTLRPLISVEYSKQVQNKMCGQVFGNLNSFWSGPFCCIRIRYSWPDSLKDLGPNIRRHLECVRSLFTYRYRYCIEPTDISQYRLRFGFSLLYMDRVPFELLDSAALLWRESCGGGGQIVFLNLTTIIYMAALSTIHDVTGRRLISSIYPWDIYDWTSILVKQCSRNRIRWCGKLKLWFNYFRNERASVLDSRSRLPEEQLAASSPFSSVLVPPARVINTNHLTLSWINL